MTLLLLVVAATNTESRRIDEAIRFLRHLPHVPVDTIDYAAYVRAVRAHDSLITRARTEVDSFAALFRDGTVVKIAAGNLFNIYQPEFPAPRPTDNLDDILRFIRAVKSLKIEHADPRSVVHALNIAEPRDCEPCYYASHHWQTDSGGARLAVIVRNANEDLRREVVSKSLVSDHRLASTGSAVYAAAGLTPPTHGEQSLATHYRYPDTTSVAYGSELQPYLEVVGSASRDEALRYLIEERRNADRTTSVLGLSLDTRASLVGLPALLLGLVFAFQSHVRHVLVIASDDPTGLHAYPFLPLFGHGIGLTVSFISLIVLPLLGLAFLILSSSRSLIETIQYQVLFGVSVFLLLILGISAYRGLSKLRRLSSSSRYLHAFLRATTGKAL